MYTSTENSLLPIVREHACYRYYHNLRGDYLRDWWSIVSWEETERRVERSSDLAAELDWEDEGGMIRSVTR